MSDDEEKATRRAGRSPAFPYLDLKVAVEKAELVYRAEMRHPANYATIAKHMGYGAKSGPGRLSFSALLKYGLIELVGEGEGSARNARLTDDAVAIILDKRAESQERRERLQAAALRPAIHRELWREFGGTLPSDDNLLYRLQMRGFTENGAKDFVAQFRRTLAYAGVDHSTRIQGAAAVKDDDQGQEALPLERSGLNTFDFLTPPQAMKTATAQPPAQPALVAASPQVVGPRVSFPLTGGNVLEVSLRRRVSRKEFQKIKAILDLAEDSLVEDESTAESQ